MPTVCPPSAKALIALLLFSGASQLHSQQPVDAARLGEPYQTLRQLGDLRLKTWSIHVLATLVVLLTTAPDSVPPKLRSIRRFLTAFLLRGLDDTGVSLLSVRAGSDSAAFNAFRTLPPGNQPQIVIAFGERAAAAAHVLARDSLPAALVALAPGASAPTAELSQTWAALLQSSTLPRAILVLESACDSSASWLAHMKHQYRQTILVLPDHDAWLAPKSSADCPVTPAHSVGIEYELTALVLDWVRRNTGFPE
jgi:hypothetical protein